MAVDDDQIRRELHRLHERCGSTTVLIHELMSFLCLEVHKAPGGELARTLADTLARAEDVSELEPVLLQLRFQFRTAGDACAKLLQSALALGDVRLIDTVWRISNQVHEALQILATLELSTAGELGPGRGAPRRE